MRCAIFKINNNEKKMREFLTRSADADPGLHDCLGCVVLLSLVVAS